MRMFAGKGDIQCSTVLSMGDVQLWLQEKY